MAEWKCHSRGGSWRKCGIRTQMPKERCTMVAERRMSVGYLEVLCNDEDLTEVGLSWLPSLQGIPGMGTLSRAPSSSIPGISASHRQRPLWNCMARSCVVRNAGVVSYTRGDHLGISWETNTGTTTGSCSQLSINRVAPRFCL